MQVEGGCHCGAVRFFADINEEPVPALDCNCSVCRMTGFLHIVVPHEKFDLLTGRDALTSYRFGTGTADHLFCRHCGVKSFYQPRSHPEAWSVNAHCLDQMPELAIETFDGANWEQAKASLDA
ncbi:GFA family protein [Sphingomonas flavescens]|uniref:GFA family protein n=1 Tax=Sphingomonas flavescens TaxID=3132797 RepID=UPI00280377F8|nr:GFA family protein [Sphingomonas limnosediminicola]